MHGSWVGDALGVTVAEHREPGAESLDLPTIELALRINPARPQLFVSRILGKHIPVPVADVLGAGTLLGDLVRSRLGGATPVVLGFAETATALGHAVAAVAAPGDSAASYVQTTRSPHADPADAVRFEEEHSHARAQAISPDAFGWLDNARPLVLVDDELTTGRTAINAIRALHRRWSRRDYVLACLTDFRSKAQRAANAADVEALGATLTTVALVHGSFNAPDTLSDQARAVVVDSPQSPTTLSARVAATTWTLQLPIGCCARQGWSPRTRPHSAPGSGRFATSPSAATLTPLSSVTRSISMSRNGSRRVSAIPSARRRRPAARCSPSTAPGTRSGP